MHTPAEIGFWHDPQIVAFCDQVKNADAGAWILRLRELVLLRGNEAGRLPGIPIERIVAVMRPTCSLPLLIAAIRKHGILRCRRKTWYVPEWKHSTAGRYVRIRTWERERKREFREAQHAAALENLNGGTDPGRPGSVPVRSPGTLGSIYIGRDRDVPSRPRGAARRAADEGAARWGWFAANYLKISAPEKCQKLLARLTPEEWEHLQFSVPRQMAKYRGERGTKFCPGAVAYLTDKRFLEIRMPDRDKIQGQEKAKKPEPRKTEAQLQAEARAHAVKSLRELLADPDAPEKQKEKAKAHWEKIWGDRPWEKGSKP